LLGKLQALARADGDDITLVLDGRPLPDVPEGEQDAVHVLYASRGGRDAADDRIVELLRDIESPSDAHVITSDRALAERARDLGATVTGAGSLLERLDHLEAPT
jgi:predicted RNA-binding protein with PIN domain